MVKALINGIKVEVPENTTILDAARKAQIKIPTLCKHPDAYLHASAACGICLVRAKGNRKIEILCSQWSSFRNSRSP